MGLYNAECARGEGFREYFLPALSVLQIRSIRRIQTRYRDFQTTESVGFQTSAVETNDIRPDTRVSMTVVGLGALYVHIRTGLIVFGAYDCTDFHIPSATYVGLYKREKKTTTYVCVRQNRTRPSARTRKRACARARVTFTFGRPRNRQLPFPRAPVA